MKRRLSIHLMVTLILMFSLIYSRVATAQANYKALNPCAYRPEVKLSPLSPRLPSLDRKVVYIITTPLGKELVDSLFPKIQEALSKYNAKAILKPRTTPYMSDDRELWDDCKKNANAFIYFAAASNSTTMWTVTWSGKLEKMGVPGAVIIYETLLDSAQLTYEKIGMPIRTVTVPYPPDKIPDRQMKEIMDKVVNALLSPLTETEKMTGSYSPAKPPKIAVEGTSDHILKYFHDREWTDGLPIIIPTEEKVAEMLKGTSQKPDKVVTKTMWPERLEVTVEKVAINGVMAGCKPEYMPVLLASVEAFASWDYESSVRSTNSFSFMQVVNGPIRNQIGMNSGIFALGPGNQANAAIGRALRLFIINLGGGRVGVNIMGTQGNVSCYSFCIPENEENSPWEPFHVSQGFKKEESTVTIFSGGWSHVGNYIDEVNPIEAIALPMANFEWPNGAVILLSPPMAKRWVTLGCKSKKDAEQRFWEKATLTMKQFKASRYYKSFIEPILKGKEMYGEKYLWPKEYLDLADDAIIQAYPRKYVKVIVVGGETNEMMQGWKMAYPFTASIDKWR